MSGFLLAEILLALTGHLYMYTKYTLICLPIILLICTDGIMSIKSDILRKGIIFIIFSTYIFNVIDYKNMPAFFVRANGYKTLTNRLNKENLTKNDSVLYTGGAIMINKYLKNTNIVDFDFLSALLVDKSKEYAYKIFDKDFVLTTNKSNVYGKLVPIIEDENPGKSLERFINSQVELIPMNGRLILAEDNSPNSLNAKQLSTLIKLTKEDKGFEKEYKKSAFLLLHNKINNDLIIILNKNKSLKLINKDSLQGPGKKGRRWVVYIYKKT